MPDKPIVYRNGETMLPTDLVIVREVVANTSGRPQVRFHTGYVKGANPEQQLVSVQTDGLPPKAFKAVDCVRAQDAWDCVEATIAAKSRRPDEIKPSKPK